MTGVVYLRTIVKMAGEATQGIVERLKVRMRETHLLGAM